MNEVQRVIKYLAVGFALFLTFSIITGIMGGLFSIGSIFDTDDDQSINEKLEGININNDSKIIDINIASSNITFKRGDNLKAETNNEYITIEESSDRLTIKEKKHSWFKTNNTDLIIYIPENYIFDGISIEAGAGKVDIKDFSTKKLYLELGAGKALINNITTINNTKIDGGAGDLTISNSTLHNLDLDLGVGKVDISSKITGISDIESGVGKVNIALVGSIDDYKIFLDKGLGTTSIDGIKVEDESIYGNGNNRIDIEGGVGSIDVVFTN